MLSKKIVFLLIPIIISSCGTNSGNILEPNPNATISTNIGDLIFTKVSNSKLAEYNNLLNNNLNTNNRESVVGDSSAPMQSSPMSSPPEAGKMSSSAGGDIAMRYFPYGGGGFEEYAVIDFEEAKLNGFSGTYLEALSKIVKPIINRLASDTRLVNTSGNTDSTGINKETNNTYKMYQWYFNFVSSEKKEIYSINISEKEVLLLRQRWGLKKLDFNNIKIDSKDAIKIFSDAIKDKNLKSTDNQEEYLATNSEIIYDIPKENIGWFFYLENDKDTLVWSISMNISYPQIYDKPVSNNENLSTRPMPIQSPPYWYSGGYARIDASTGKILNFTRPSKFKNDISQEEPTMPYASSQPAIMPMPSVSTLE